MVEVMVRVECSGWRCRELSGNRTVFEGFLPVDFLGRDNLLIVRLDSLHGWTVKHYPDAPHGEPRCPTCSKDGD